MEDLNRESKSVYDSVGMRVKSIDRRGNATVTEYDALDRPFQISDARNQTLVHTYDKVGNLRFLQDKRGNIKETVYDGLNRPSEVFIHQASTGNTPEEETGNTRFRLALHE